MKLVPLGDKVVIRRVDAEAATPGGIVLPDAAREAPAEGRVLSVGDGRALADGSRSAPQVREGDRVLFSKWSGTPIRIDGEELLILAESDILAICG